MRKSRSLSQIARCLGALLLLGHALAASAAEGAGQGEAELTKVVIQVSTGDTQVQKMLIKNIENLQREIGADNLRVEVVAYGPGLGLVTADSSSRQQVEALSDTVRFTACENTIDAIEKRTGQRPELADGVGTVPSGIAHVVRLQQQGYAYITPQ